MSFSISNNKVVKSNRGSYLNLSTTVVTASSSILMDKIKLVFPVSGKIIIGSSSINTSGNSISIGRGCGDGTDSINIGRGANSPSNANNSICIGYATGQNNNQGNTICIGHQDGTSNSKQNSVIIGAAGSFLGSGVGSVSLGGAVSYNCPNNDYSVSLGYNAGTNTQGSYSVAIGYQSAYYIQNSYSISIGFQSGYTSQPSKSIVLNASGGAFSPVTANALYVNPLRSASVASEKPLSWDSTTKELYLNTDVAKTFVDNHPLDNEKYLVHACLEGPEAGVYYRGKAEITNCESVEVILPEYTKSFSDFTVQISPIYDGEIKSYNTSEVSDGKFIVYGNNGKFSWMVHALRSHIETEPLKSETEVKGGDSPYKYI
jgi:hypothetical protein